MNERKIEGKEKNKTSKRLLASGALLASLLGGQAFAISLGQGFPQAVRQSVIVNEKLQQGENDAKLLAAKLENASGGFPQKPLKSIGGLSFETQYSTGFNLTLSANLRRISFKDSMNLYQSFGNNPVNFTDPMGEETWKQFYERERALIVAREINVLRKQISSEDYIKESLKKLWLASNEQNTLVEEMPGTTEAFLQGLNPFKKKVNKFTNFAPDYADKMGNKLWAVNRGKMDSEMEGEVGFLQDRYVQGGKLIGDLTGSIARELVDQGQWIAFFGSLSKLTGKIHGHHSYPKALGGHSDQVLAEIVDSMHIGVGGIHSSISKFEGGWLRPTRLMSGKAIVEKYGQKSVEEGLRRFYSQDKWRHLLQVFEDAVNFTHKMSGQ